MNDDSDVDIKFSSDDEEENFIIDDDNEVSSRHNHKLTHNISDYPKIFNLDFNNDRSSHRNNKSLSLTD